MGELSGEGAAARSERDSVEALLGDGADELEVDGVVDAPGLEGLFEQGAVVHDASCGEDEDKREREEWLVALRPRRRAQGKQGARGKETAGSSLRSE